MAFRVISFNIYDEILYEPGHLIDRWAVDVGLTIKAATIAEAPFNKRRNKSRSPKTAQPTGPPGFLKANIDVSKTRAGLRSFLLNSTSGAGYSMYVIRGTLGGKSARPRYKLPPNMGFDGKKKIKSFAGQKGNNFMIRGLDRAALKHSCLRG